jgi:hypothetical protein
MTPGQTALAGLVSGACFALGLMGTYAARAAYTMTRRNAWHHLKQL